MRRDTDFVLEKASWPAMVLEAGGGICRANQTARRVFDLADNLRGASLASLWDEKNSGAAADLLKEQNGESTPRIKLRVRTGVAGSFYAQVAKVVREEQDYYVLQLFKEAGSNFSELACAPLPAAAVPVPEKKEPPDPPKPSAEEFVLQSAEWPVFLVRKSGGIVWSNRFAAQLFGPAMAGENAALATIWSPQNEGSWQSFFNRPSSAEPAALKLQLTGGLMETYSAQLCPAGKEDIFVLQLLKAVPPVPEKAPEPPAPVPMAARPPVPAIPSPETGKTGVEANLAHKQKLDCALQLARSVALDFNNALTSILGHTSLLLSKAEGNHPWRNSLGEIEKSAAKAAEIANDLAAFSRQEKDVRVQVAGNVNSLLGRTVEMFQGSMEQRNIAFTQQLERKLFTANFDEAKMQQALVKIFENAVESIKGDGKINVQTRNVELTEATQDRTAKLNPGNYVCVEISDTGSGIGDDVMPRIFEPFFTTKGSAHRGLGLAWVYGIVTNHGGGVAVSSQVDIGTAVRLYLPASSKIVRDAPMADGDLRGTQTILLVDDEDLLLTMGQMVLSSFGYTVLTANSGQKALELFHAKKKIDLVITDLVMPNMSGRELTEHILRLSPEICIIWSSGYVRSNTEEQERYLQKPFSAQDLLRKVKQVLSHQSGA